MNKTGLRILILAGLLPALACSLVTPVTPVPGPAVTDTATVTATTIPTDTPTPAPTDTPTPAPLSQSVTLTSVHFEESGQSPNYTITSETPALTGVDDQRVDAFNATAAAVVDHDVNEFKASLKYQPPTPITSGSFIDVKYEVLSPPGDILSIKFNAMGYGDGAAHPYHYSQTLTFDLERGLQIQLFQLFQSDASYLQVIADYCKAELSTRDIAFDAFITGADPTEENYRNWNLTADGLLITFDEYQVAAYAAGPQTVLIPYSQLSSILDPQGPAAKIMH